MSVQQEDAARVATTRKQAASRTRNQYIRDAVGTLGKGDGGKAALGILTFSVWSQAQILGLEDMPTLYVAVKP